MRHFAGNKIVGTNSERTSLGNLVLESTTFYETDTGKIFLYTNNAWKQSGGSSSMDDDLDMQGNDILDVGGLAIGKEAVASGLAFDLEGNARVDGNLSIQNYFTSFGSAEFHSGVSLLSIQNLLNTQDPITSASPLQVNSRIDAVGDIVAFSGEADEVSMSNLRSHLDNYSLHRQINDNAISSTSLWSSQKISNELANAGSGGSSTLSGLTDVSLGTLSSNDFFTYNGVTGKWSNRSASGSRAALGLTGDNVTNHYHDSRYYTKTEIDQELQYKADLLSNNIWSGEQEFTDQISIRGWKSMIEVWDDVWPALHFRVDTSDTGKEVYVSNLDVGEDIEVQGTVTATSFVGDGSGLTNLPGGGGTNILPLNNDWTGINTFKNTVFFHQADLDLQGNNIEYVNNLLVSAIGNDMDFPVTYWSDIDMDGNDIINVGNISGDGSGLTNLNITGQLGYTPEDRAMKSAPSGYAPLNTEKQIPNSYLPERNQVQTYIADSFSLLPGEAGSDYGFVVQNANIPAFNGFYRYGGIFDVWNIFNAEWYEKDGDTSYGIIFSGNKWCWIITDNMPSTKDQNYNPSSNDAYYQSEAMTYKEQPQPTNVTTWEAYNGAEASPISVVADGSNMVVSGGPNHYFQGTYIPDGSYNGRTKYVKPDFPNYGIIFSEDVTISSWDRWVITDSYQTPFETNWDTGPGGGFVDYQENGPSATLPSDVTNWNAFGSGNVYTISLRQETHHINPGYLNVGDVGIVINTNTKQMQVYRWTGDETWGWHLTSE